MTSKQSTARLVLYVLQSLVAASVTGLMAVDFSDWRQVTLFCLGIIAAGLNTVRSYIDQSQSQIGKP